jgi:hypothetical protein
VDEAVQGAAAVIGKVKATTGRGVALSSLVNCWKLWRCVSWQGLEKTAQRQPNRRSGYGSRRSCQGGDCRISGGIGAGRISSKQARCSSGYAFETPKASFMPAQGIRPGFIAPSTISSAEGATHPSSTPGATASML